MALYFDMDMKMDNIDMEVCVPVAGEIAGEGEVTGHVLPGGKFLSLLYRGPYDTVGSTYEALIAYMQEKGLEPAGPSREIYLTDPSQVESPADNLTEIVFPVT